MSDTSSPALMERLATINTCMPGSAGPISHNTHLVPLQVEAERIGIAAVVEEEEGGEERRAALLGLWGGEAGQGGLAG